MTASLALITLGFKWTSVADQPGNGIDPLSEACLEVEQLVLLEYRLIFEILQFSGKCSAFGIILHHPGCSWSLVLAL